FFIFTLLIHSLTNIRKTIGCLVDGTDTSSEKMRMNPATMFTILLFLATVLPVSFCIAQNGKIISKTTIDLTTTTACDRVAEGDSLKPELSHLDKLEFYAITYQSDSLEVEGMLVVPKANGKYPVVIFNRGGNRTFAPLTIETLVMYTAKL